MSVQRWSVVRTIPSDWEVGIPDESGKWVMYADHVAEVERVRNCDEKACAIADRKRAEGAEAMRAACIAAVDTQPWSTDLKRVVITTLREVEPRLSDPTAKV